MSFQESAESLKAKAHLSAVKTPVLIGVTVVALVILFCCLQGLFELFSSHPFEVVSLDAPVSSGDSASTNAVDTASRSEASPIVVHVGGAVVASGVYELPEGSRVQAAIDAAGGFALGAATDALNCARILKDGEQVVVPLLASSEEASTSTAVKTDPTVQVASDKININSASLEELDTLSGVGEATARRIIADREAQGSFETIEDLKRVSGIGEKKYAALADSICV